MNPSVETRYDSDRVAPRSASSSAAERAERAWADRVPPKPDWPPNATGPQHFAFWDKRLKGSDRKFIYVIQAGGIDAPIKVGKAKDPMKRIATLQTGNANPIKLLFVIPGYDAMERAFHGMLVDNRLTGEWFSGQGVNAFLWWLSAYCETEKDHYWQTGELPRVPELPEEPQEPGERRSYRPVTVAQRSRRRNRRARYRTT